MNVRAAGFGGGALDAPGGIDIEAGRLGALPARGRRWMLLAVAIGPGLMVMLADTDAGSVVTAAQSGARFGYRLLPLEVLLIPVLYLVMELTVRLGLTTGKGHAELIKERFGAGWAAFSVGILLVTSVGALVTEFAGIAGVGSIVGLPPLLIVPGAAALLLLVVVSGTYRRVELIGIGLGLFELAFLVAAVRAHPDPGALAGSLVSGQPLGQLGLPGPGRGQRRGRGDALDDLLPAGRDPRQGDHRPRHQGGAGGHRHRRGGHPGDHDRGPRGDRGKPLPPPPRVPQHRRPDLDRAHLLARRRRRRLAFAMGVAGAALVAAMVVSLGAAWAFAEVAGQAPQPQPEVRQAPLFYGVFTRGGGALPVLVLTSSSLVGPGHRRRDPQRAAASDRAGLPDRPRLDRAARSPTACGSGSGCSSWP